MSTLTTTDPRTGVSTDSGISTTTTEAIAEYTRDALRAFSDMRRRSRAWRSGLLRALAAGLERDRAALVDAAISETGLTEGRLNTELTRSAFQFRLFADAVDEGGFPPA